MKKVGQSNTTTAIPKLYQEAVNTGLNAAAFCRHLIMNQVAGGVLASGIYAPTGSLCVCFRDVGF